MAMEKELLALQKSLDERNAMAMSTASVAEQVNLLMHPYLLLRCYRIVSVSGALESCLPCLF
jgi:hypothetical protein